MLHRSLLLLFSLLIFSCKREKIVSEGLLHFSTDSLFFDTVFAEIPTLTLQLKAYNRLGSDLKISKIQVAKGKQSFFLLNIDGRATLSETDYVLRAGDSMYIFVKAAIKGNQNYLLERDSIVFESGNIQQHVKLLAWAKDVVVQNGLTVYSDTTISSVKPILFRKDLVIQPQGKLRLGAGTELYFNRNTGITIYGSIYANGSKDSMILIKSSRIDDIYKDIPGQWKGIIIESANSEQYFNYIHVSQAIHGIKSGNPLLNINGGKVTITNSLLTYHSYACMNFFQTEVIANNTIAYISYAGTYGCLIEGGGKYTLTHSNFYADQPHGAPLFSFSDSYSGQNSELHLDLSNSIVYGPEKNEFYGDLIQPGTTNLLIRNNLIKTTQNTGDTNIYKENILEPVSRLFKNAYFLDFTPDSLSSIIDHADIEVSQTVPIDFKGNNRLTDEFPDIGAIEKK